jgi:hypothetical protein
MVMMVVMMVGAMYMDVQIQGHVTTIRMQQLMMDVNMLKIIIIAMENV